MNDANEQPQLKQMEGVRVAPVSGEPLDATGSATAVANAAPAAVVASPSTVSSSPVVASTPVVTQTSDVAPVPANPPVSTEPPVPPTSSVLENSSEPSKKEKKKKGFSFTPFLLILIMFLGGYIYYQSTSQQKLFENMKYNCTPITASKETIDLDLNSTIVQDLYSKVVTNIREDIAQPEFNDEMKLYLAYRQILDSEKYDSNCNLFSNVSMEPFTCEVSTNFVPKAFKEETMRLAIKKLYGEDSTLTLKNIQLGTSCIGGYQYVAARGEFVQGYCNQYVATSYKVTKNLVSATSTRNVIVLKEEVKYHENEKLSLPDYLKSGYYYYTFRLDMNYHYVLVSKTYEMKY